MLHLMRLGSATPADKEAGRQSDQDQAYNQPHAPRTLQNGAFVRRQSVSRNRCWAFSRFRWPGRVGPSQIGYSDGVYLRCSGCVDNNDNSPGRRYGDSSACAIRSATNLLSGGDQCIGNPITSPTTDFGIESADVCVTGLNTP
jgi:hypothetical protein